MNEAIAITNATLGVVLLLVLFLRVRDVGAELNLKKYRSKDAGLADLLNYAAMCNGSRLKSVGLAFNAILGSN